MIERADLEAKFKEIQGIVDETATAAKNTGVMLAVGLVVLMLIIFFLGRRKGKKGSAQLQVYRLG